jgi:uncharacterized membrane protein YfcA
MKAGLLRDALALLVGFLTGVLSALFGIGGAIVSNPGLRALGAAPLVAVGTTLPSILPGAISGTLRYRREGLIDWRLIAPAAAVPGQGHLLLLLIAVLLAFTAWRTAFTGPSTTRENDELPPTTGAGEREGGERGARETEGGDTGVGDEGAADRGAGDSREHPTSRSATLPLRGASRRRVGFLRADAPGPGAPAQGAPGPGSPGAGVPGPGAPGSASGLGAAAGSSGGLVPRQRWLAVGIGLVAGLLSGLLGIGGGVIMVPAFTELLSMSLKSAIATSLVCVGIFGVPATITHAFLGDIDWRLAIPLTIGVIPGARVGAALTIRTAERRLRLAVGVFLALVALLYFVTETRALLAL